MSNGGMCGRVWDGVKTIVDTIGSIPMPGGSTDPDDALAGGDGEGDGDLGDDTMLCPVPCHITIVTRAGDIPVPGVSVYNEGRLVGRSDLTGVVRGFLSACGGTARLNAIYVNDPRRVKREEFSLDISGIDVEAETATGGQARNFIGKVQDVFGSGQGGFPGDKDFVDSYDGADLVSMGEPPEGGVVSILITIKLATLSLSVPYRNQRDQNETIAGVAQTGDSLCAPSSAEMVAGYWGIQKVTTEADGSETRVALDRVDIMQKACDPPYTNLHTLDTFPRHWQMFWILRAVLGSFAESSLPGAYTAGAGPEGAYTETIPSAYANSLTAALARGIPVVISTHATAGHVMAAIGAVVKHDGNTEWNIFNDPYGTLAGQDSVYGTIVLQGPVGARGNHEGPMNDPADVTAVQEALGKLGLYTGPIGAEIDEDDPDDPTVAAIRAFQGGRNPDGRIDPGGGTLNRLNARVRSGRSPSYSDRENERNTEAAPDRGRHVYYNGGTSGNSNGFFRLKAEQRTAVVEPVTPLGLLQLTGRLNPGTPVDG